LFAADTYVAKELWEAQQILCDIEVKKMDDGKG
jgi:hypothetical protein